MRDGSPSAAKERARLPLWIRLEFGLIIAGSVVMNVWSPRQEPWWWRLMFLVLFTVCAFGLLEDSRRGR